MDGELWLGRGRFEALSGIVRKTAPQDDEWRQINYMIFELPSAPGAFAERARRIKEIVAQAGWGQLVAVEQFRVADRAVLKRRLDEVVRGGGEGLMLHLADASYVTGRSDVLLKLKPLQDTEAVVIEHVPGKGKYQVRLLTARECARLQGVPDDYVIDVNPNKALFGFGDAVCVPAVEWIAEHYLAKLAGTNNAS